MESTSPYQIHYAALQTRIQAFQASMHHFLQVYTKTPGQYSQDSLHLVTQHLEHNYHTLLNECQNYINQLDFLEKTSTVIDNTFSPHLPVSSNNLATISSQSISHDMSCFDINLLDMNLTPPQPEYTLHPTQPIVSIQSQSNQTKSNKKIKTLPLQNKQYFNLIPIKAIPFQDNMNIIDINSSNYDIELEACLQILSPDVAPTIINPSLSNLPSISPNDNIPLMINYSDKGSNNFIHSEQLHQQCKLLAKTFGLSHTNLVLPQLYDNQPHNIPLALPQLTVTQGAMSHGLLIIRRLTLLTLQCELLGSFFLNFFKFNETRDVSSTSGSHVHQGVIPAPPQSQQQVLLQQQQQQLLRQQQQQQQLQRYQQEMYNEQQQQQRLQGFAQGFQ